MKKIFTVLALTVLAVFCASQVWAAAGAAAVYESNLVVDNSTFYGETGTLSADNTTVTWTRSAMTTIEDSNNLTGVYFFFKKIDGDASSIKVNFYTSFKASGDADWSILAPDDVITKTPTDYDLTMPSVSKTWTTPKLLIADGVLRIKAVFDFQATLAGAMVTDIISVKLIPSTSSGNH